MLLGGSKLYKQQSEKLGINNFLQLSETGSNEYIKKFLNTLNVFTHGRKHGETFGLVIAEAMQHSLPIISHKAESNAHVELIGKGGKVVGRKNTIAYSMEMKKLVATKIVVIMVVVIMVAVIVVVYRQLRGRRLTAKKRNSI